MEIEGFKKRTCLGEPGRMVTLPEDISKMGS